MGESRGGEGRAGGPTTDIVAEEFRELARRRGKKIQVLEVQPFIQDLVRVEAWYEGEEGSEVGFLREGDATAITQTLSPTGTGKPKKADS